MIEPHLSDRYCKHCKAWKPAGMFYAKAGRCCKACKSALTGRRRGWKPKEDFRWPTHPGDPRTFGQQLLAATQRRWTYPVQPAQLRASL